MHYADSICSGSWEEKEYSANNFFFGGLTNIMPEAWAPLINGIGITAIGWVFLYILFKNKIFLKV